MSSLTNWKFLEMKPMNNNTKNTPINENNNKDKYHIKDQQAAETKSYDSFESIKSEEGFTPLTTNNNKTSSITIKAKSCSTSNKKQQNSLVRNQQEKETNKGKNAYQGPPSLRSGDAYRIRAAVVSTISNDTKTKI